MAKISYSEDDKQAKIEMEGNSVDLFRAVSRIAAYLKADIKMKDGKTFEEVLLEGIEVAELERNLQDAKGVSDKNKDIDLSKLVDLLEKLLND